MAWKNSYPQNMGKKRRTKKNFTRSIQSLFNSCSKAWFHCFKWLFWATWNSWCKKMFKSITFFCQLGLPNTTVITVLLYSINEINLFISLTVMQYLYIYYIKCEHGFLYMLIHGKLVSKGLPVSRGSLPAQVRSSLHMKLKEWIEWSGLHFLHIFNRLSPQVFILEQFSQWNLSLTQMTICYPLQQQQEDIY